MFIIPAKGLKVYDPQRKRHLPTSGLEVAETVYWIRRLKAGDVVLIPHRVLEVDQDLSSEEPKPVSEEIDP